MGSGQIQQQWDAVKAAPMLYLAAFTVLVITVWAVMHFLFRQRLASKDERIELLRSHLEAAQREGSRTHTPLDKVGSDDVPHRAATPTPSEGRIFLGASVDVDFLTDLCLNKTNVQAARAMQPYLNKWIKVSGKVEDVQELGPTTLRVIIRIPWDMGDLPLWKTIWASFDKGFDALEALRPGETISLSGRVDRVSSMGIDLQDCELDA